MLRVLLSRSGYDVQCCQSATECLSQIAQASAFDAVVTDLVMPDGSGMDILEAVKSKDKSTQVVMMTAYATTEQAVDAMRKGAYDYVQKPFRNHLLLATLEKALEKRVIVEENRALRAQVEGASDGSRLIGTSEAIKKVRSMVERVCNAPTSVFITGPSGTGKELIARELHGRSDRCDHPFVVINCGALPENLMESELFGYEKGAFTGAAKAKDGLFKAAHGGTLFLDEIGELPLSLQVKLLRVLQERRVRAIGGRDELEVDVRVVAATNRNVEQEVDEGRFREDLFYRLNVIRIQAPPLEQRREDIPMLAAFFVRKHGAIQRKQLTLSPEVMRHLSLLAFPGNIRELENIVERAVTLARKETIDVEDLPGIEAASGTRRSIELIPEEGFVLDDYLATIEKNLLLQSLVQAFGVRTKAAKLLGTSFRSLRYRLSKYGIDDEEEA